MTDENNDVKTLLKYCGISAVFLGVVTLVAYLTFDDSPEARAKRVQSRSAVMQEKESAPPVEPAVKTSDWYYLDFEDDMTGRKTFLATIDSTNRVNFGFPYSGAQSATLKLRTHPRWGKDVILSISRGQFQCSSYSGCSLLVRFDDEPPVRYSAVEPSDNDSTYIFFQGYSNFVGRMMKSKRVRIEAQFYQEGSRIFEFNVEGFDADHYLGKK